MSNTTPRRLLVIDGNSIINRAFYGIRALSTADGKPTNAIYGMINIISRQIDSLQPDYAAVAFDLHTPTFRHKAYEGYKAGRHPTPEELLAQFDDAKECMTALGIKVISLEGYEADDLLGTCAAMAQSDAEEIQTYILSGDRDLLQLIGDETFVLLAGNNDTLLFDRARFREKYGVEPEQFVDVKALMGDSSDNIPGVPGVGEKTALKLISEFSSLDGVYASLDSRNITQGLRTKLQNGKDSATLSKFLSAINKEVPVKFSLHDLRYEGLNRPLLYKKCKELEFFGFIRRFGLQELTAESTAEEECAQSKKSPSTEATYPLATVADLLSATDTFAVQKKEDAYYFSFADASGNQRNFCYNADPRALAPLFDGSRRVICLDGKSLWHTLDRDGITPAFCPRDLLLYAYVLHPDTPAKTPDDLFRTEGILYTAAVPYPHLLHGLETILYTRVKEIGAERLLNEIELPLISVLAEMEKAGMHLDTEGMRAFGEQLREFTEATAQKIYEMAGVEFNLNSPKQLSDVLYNRLGLPAGKKRKGGYSTDMEELQRLEKYHPIISLLLDYRHTSKLYSTYAAVLPGLADGQGRIHTEFNQTVTATGRLSSTEPNLQNIPVRTELGRAIRRFFTAQNEDYVLVDADYSQIELRLIAHMSGDETMIEAFRAGADIHTHTASVVFGVFEEAVTEEMRKRAKAVNFGIMYGIGAYSLANDLGITNAQADQYIRSYLAGFPRISAYLDKTVEDAAKEGYTTTLYGRRRPIPELRSEVKRLQAFGKRIAMNSPIQGSAADIIKVAMLRIAERLKKEGLDARQVMQVHDELIIEAAGSCADRVCEILREEMENVIQLSVPLTVDTAMGFAWDF